MSAPITDTTLAEQLASYDWLTPSLDERIATARALDHEERVSRIEAMADHTNHCLGCPICWTPEIADREAWRGI